MAGRVQLNPAGRALLLQAFPPVGHVRAPAASSDRLRAITGQLVGELAARRMGSDFAVRQYAQLLLLEVLRAYVGQASLPPGRLRVLTDERLRPAVSPDARRTRPGVEAGRTRPRRGDVPDHVRRAVSPGGRRAAADLPERLAHAGGQRALRDGDVRLGPLATRLGYASESAFSTAFKREVGESPLRYRSRIRGDPPRDDE